MQTAAGIPAKPMLRPWYRRHSDADSIVFQYGESVVSFHGKAVAPVLTPLLDLLDGKRTVDQILANFSPELAAPVMRALEMLQLRKVLIDGDELATLGVDAPAAFWSINDGLQTSVSSIEERLRAQVSVVGTTSFAVRIAGALSRSGMTHVVQREWSDARAHDGFAVVAPGAHERSRLAAFNEAALAAQQPWMQVFAFDGSFAAIGPVFVPGETCCATCYSLRRSSNVADGETYRRVADADARVPSLDAIECIMEGLVTLLVTRWLLGSDPSLPGRFYALSLGDDIALAPHMVYRVPRCPSCSIAARTAGMLPWYEQSAG